MDKIKWRTIFYFMAYVALLQIVINLMFSFVTWKNPLSVFEWADLRYVIAQWFLIACVTAAWNIWKGRQTK